MNPWARHFVRTPGARRHTLTPPTPTRTRTHATRDDVRDADVYDVGGDGLVRDRAASVATPATGALSWCGW